MEKVGMPQGSVFEGVQDIKNKNKKTKRRARCQMHTSASVQFQSPAPKAVKHNLQE